MPVLDESALAASPLADLHALATELGLDGFRRLRKADLIRAILEHQGITPSPPAAEDEGDSASTQSDEGEGEGEGDGDGEGRRPRRRRRGGRSRRRRDADDGETGAETDAGETEESEQAVTPSARATSTGRRRRGTEAGGRDDAEPEPARDAQGSRGPRDGDDERVVEGTVELLGNGSGFVRVDPPEPSDHDVYISAAQVRRCELVSGDVVSGPVRRPRRSERYPSLVRVDTINGAAADQVAAGTRWEDLPAAFPTERLALGGEDPTVRAVEWLTPFGRGSRVTIAGPARAGKSETLRRLAEALSRVDGLEVSVALVGVRPEEIGAWPSGATAPVATASFTASPDTQAAAAERAVEQARRVAGRGAHAVLLVDTLDGLADLAARRVLGAARNIPDAGSLTVIATASAPLGGETTTITLDAGLASTGRFPALDLGASGSMRPELLVGEAGAAAIAKARGEALDV